MSFLLAKSNVYGRLMRLDKPVGIALLWAPTAWALWLANHRSPPVALVIYFFLGTVFMRSAGCVMNDMADRSIDPHVHRTRLRPLACGELAFSKAIAALLVLLALAAAILIQLPKACWWEAVFALGITAIYPFAKRWIKAPQLLLSIAFSMGIPMAYSASGRGFDASMWIVMGLNALWILAYDTIYALMDKEDDLRLGVYSTAILFDDHLPKFMVLLQMGFHGLWLFLGMTRVISQWFDLCWVLGLAILVHQHRLLKQETTQAYLHAFWWHAVYGCVMWIGLF